MFTKVIQFFTSFPWEDSNRRRRKVQNSEYSFITFIWLFSSRTQWGRKSILGTDQKQNAIYSSGLLRRICWDPPNEEAILKRNFGVICVREMFHHWGCLSVTLSLSICNYSGSFEVWISVMKFWKENYMKWDICLPERIFTVEWRTISKAPVPLENTIVTTYCLLVNDS